MICPKCTEHHDAPHQWCLDCLQWKASGEAAQRRESLEQLLGLLIVNDNYDLLEDFLDEDDLEAATAEIILQAVRDGALR